MLTFSRIRAGVAMAACFLFIAASGLAAQPAAPLSGRVVLLGTPPQATVVPLDADPYCSSQHEDPLRLGPVRVDAEGGLADVLVYVVDAPSGASVPVADEVVIEQRGCTYSPHVLAVRVGQTVVFRNTDRTLHNLNVQPRDNRPFNIGQPIPGMESRRQFATAELGIPIRCDVHPWMSAVLHVLDHPYFALSDASGHFTIAGLPPGTYRVETWHESLGRLSQQVTVAPEGAAVQFRYPDH